MVHRMVTVTDASQAAMEGWLFAATTPMAGVPANQGFAAVLENPASSGRVLRIRTIFLNTMLSRTAELRLNATPGAPLTPGMITNLNTRFLNRMSVARLGFTTGPNVTPTGQLILFLRAEPDETTVLEVDGRIVLAPGSNLAVFLPPVGEEDTVAVTFIFSESGMAMLQGK